MGKVYINGREAVHQGCGGMSVAFPDVCLCPPGPPAGPVPAPLTNIVKAKDLQNGAHTVTIDGNPVGHVESYFARSTGDEVARSTGGGIITHTVQGKAYFHTGSRNVFIEGKPAVRQGDLLTHNHVTRIPGNTPTTIWMATVAPGAQATLPPKDTEIELREGKDWIELALVDVAGQPAASVVYRVRTPAGKEVEGRVLWGGTVRIQGIASGTCKISFPSFDEGAHEPELYPGDQIPKPSTKACQRSGADKAYKPGSPLELATRATHKVELPLRPSYWLTVPKPRKKTRQDQVVRYTLTNTDGTYQVTRAIKEHIRRARDASVLEFPGIEPEGKYSLHAVLGKGQKFPLFVARKWSEIQTAGTPRKQAKRARGTRRSSLRDAQGVSSPSLRESEDLIDPEAEDAGE